MNLWAHVLGHFSPVLWAQSARPSDHIIVFKSALWGLKPSGDPAVDSQWQWFLRLSGGLFQWCLYTKRLSGEVSAVKLQTEYWLASSWCLFCVHQIRWLEIKSCESLSFHVICVMISKLTSIDSTSSNLIPCFLDYSAPLVSDFKIVNCKVITAVSWTSFSKVLHFFCLSPRFCSCFLPVSFLPLLILWPLYMSSFCPF